MHTEEYSRGNVTLTAEDDEAEGYTQYAIRTPTIDYLSNLLTSPSRESYGDGEEEEAEFRAARAAFLGRLETIAIAIQTHTSMQEQGFIATTAEGAVHLFISDTGGDQFVSCVMTILPDDAADLAVLLLEEVARRRAA